MIDTLYNYKGFSGCDSKCWIRIFSKDLAYIVIATELPDNPGTSITNTAAALATSVAIEFDIEPERLVWIEHYPARPDADHDETYDLVTFTWDGLRFSEPQWKHLGKEKAELIAGIQLDQAAHRQLH